MHLLIVVVMGSKEVSGFAAELAPIDPRPSLFDVAPPSPSSTPLVNRPASTNSTQSAHP